MGLPTGGLYGQCMGGRIHLGGGALLRRSSSAVGFSQAFLTRDAALTVLLSGLSSVSGALSWTVTGQERR